MTCLVPANHPSEHFSIINITSTDSSVQESAMEGGSLDSMNKLYIPYHYICLRARLPTFPAALSHDGLHGECLIDVTTIHIYSELSILVSRLCSTNGCIRDDHVVIESASISGSRQHCDGLIISLAPYGLTTAKHVIQIHECNHGAKHPYAGGDFLRYSCRKIRVVLLDGVAMAYLRNFQ